LHSKKKKRLAFQDAFRAAVAEDLDMPVSAEFAKIYRILCLNMQKYRIPYLNTPKYRAIFEYAKIYDTVFEDAKI